MDQGYGLAVLGKETSVGHIYHLHHFRVIADLQRHGVRVLGSRKNHIYGESRAHCLSGAAGIKVESNRARRHADGFGNLTGRGASWSSLWLRGRLSRRDWSNRRRRILMAHLAQLNGVGGAYVQSFLIHIAIFMGAHDVRDEDEDGLSFRVVLGGLRKEIL